MQEYAPLYLHVLAVISLGISFVSTRKVHDCPHLAAALAKYSSRIFLISAACLLLKNADRIILYGMDYVYWLNVDYYAKIVMRNFNGQNYSYFFKYFMDMYVIACLALLFPYFFYWDKEIPAHEDKYVSLMASLFSLGSIVLLKKPYWSQTSKLGLQTVCVKLFFVPLLVSWVINNTLHQMNLSRVLLWDLAAINAYLVALLIYIDTAVFCFGYLFEFGFLQNRIKSVEPTLLGWAVCLWCYPPFNEFSFRFFDHQLIDVTRTYPSWVVAAATCAITLLWGVFAWASVALGWKASNLTNRGIVSTGPYRFVRHPAYTAKLLIFYLQGVFLGSYYVGLLLGFTLIYVLRAWTEERHLSADRDYLEYKKSVVYWFIPKVI